MNDAPPLVSIGMPVRNNERTLALAIRSILNQTYTNWELLLIDDGSSDATPDIARNFAEADERIRFSSDGQPLGLPERLNQTIAASRGEYFARMDGDDVAYPMRLERQVDYLQRHPEVDLVGAWAIIFGREGVVFGKRTGAEHHEAICNRPHIGFPLIHPTYFGRIEFFRRYGYRSSAVRCEDQEMLLRAHLGAHRNDELNRSLIKFGNVPSILLGYREEYLDMNKILVSRFYHAKSFLKLFFSLGHPITAFRASVGQGLRAIVDVCAITSGLGYRLLRHRALPVTAAEIEEWDHIWLSHSI